MRFMSIKEVSKTVLYSRTHITRMVSAGTFPKPKPLGNGPRCRKGYVDVEVLAWMKSKGYPIPDETNGTSSE